MTPRHRFGILATFLLLAFGLHMAFGHLLAIHGTQPDLTLTVLLISSMFCNANEAATLGFFAGLMEASAAPINVGTTVVTRTLTGFMVGWMELRIFRESPYVALLTVFLGTVFAYLCVMLFAPPPNLARWALHAVMEALYNAAFAVPLYLPIRRAIRGPVQTVGRRYR